MTSSTSVPGSSIGPKYTAFTITHVDYKQVNGTAIPASILVPNDLKSGKHPVTVRWHGGGFATGHRLFADWYPEFILDFCAKHAAIIISPDYRLIPESNGMDVLADIRDFFSWLQSPGTLAAHLPPGVSPDLGDVLVTGESAGGWMALQSAFLAPATTRAVIAHYPMIDLRGPYFAQSYHKDLFDPPAPQVDPKVLSDYVAGLRGDEVVANRMPPAGVELVLSLVQQGLYQRLFGNQPELHPLEVLDEKTGFPPTWILHGDADNIVPIDGSEKFAQKLEQKFGKDAPLHVSWRKGEGHGFDNHEAEGGKPAKLDSQWVVPGVEFVERCWPRK